MRCTTDKYNFLYANYLKNPQELLDWGGFDPLKYDKFIDLCSGTGVVSKEVIKRYNEVSDERRNKGGYWAWVTLFDLNPRFKVPLDIHEKIFVSQFKGDFQKKDYPFNVCVAECDYMVCRQAINYLDIKKLAEQIDTHGNLNGMVFVFNTFVKPPRFKFKKYSLPFNRKKYREVTSSFNNKVYHVQNCGFDFDFTVFNYYSHEYIKKVFEDNGFKLEKYEENGNSARYKWFYGPLFKLKND